MLPKSKPVPDDSWDAIRKSPRTRMPHGIKSLRPSVRCRIGSYMRSIRQGGNYPSAMFLAGEMRQIVTYRGQVYSAVAGDRFTVRAVPLNAA